jgi:proliferating cell nuclear antigen
MELILDNPVLFKKSMEVISDLVIEGTFVFKKDYVELVALNSNNVVMIIFKLLKTNFSKYEVAEEKNISLNLEHFTKVLKSCDDKLQLKIVIENEDKLMIVSGDREKNNKIFELSLLDFSNDNLNKIPTLEFPVKLAIESQDLTKTINDLSFIEEGVTFKAKEKTFLIEGKSNSMSGKIELDDRVSITTSDDKEYSSRYSMDYLKKFTKCDKIVKECELSFGLEYPLKVDYKLVDKLLLSFILAPRGED